VMRANNRRRRLEGSLRLCTPDPLLTETLPDAGGEIDVVLTREVQFGFFAKLSGGLNALLHKSNIPLSRQLTVNDHVRVVVLEIDRLRRRASLACPECVATGGYLPNAVDGEWTAQRARYPDGTRVEGVVRAKALPGLVVVLPDGATGLVPTRETDWARSGLDGWRIGDSVVALVTGANEGKQQLKLSIRACLPWPFDVNVADSAVPLLGEVSKVVDYGAFVKLPQGVEGLLHRDRIPTETALSAGDKILVTVEKVDRERKRISLDLANAAAHPAARL
jgi:small subunit ribosomal protein S1